MFTGIVEETAVVESVKPGARSIQLLVRLDRCARGLKTGDSLAVNGCCLTVVRLAGSGRRKTARFDLLRETWDLTNLSHARVGAAVNLERSMPADGRMDGHFVTGHIDGTGVITRWERAGRDRVLEITPPPGLMRYIVLKGSIAVDGISLTVAAVAARRFRVWIIPHTWENTTLRNRKPGDDLNIETDMLARYLERLLDARKSNITEEMLTNAGFA
jgi:riboflavin synthase